MVDRLLQPLSLEFASTFSIGSGSLAILVFSKSGEHLVSPMFDCPNVNFDKFCLPGSEKHIPVLEILPVDYKCVIL